MRKKNKTLRAKSKSIPSFANGKEFDSLSAAEKESVWASYNRVVPLSETRALDTAGRAHWKAAKKKMGRPRIGKGSKLISVTVEKDLLKRADAYAKELGLKRAQLIALGLRSVLPLGGNRKSSPGA